MTVEMTGVQTPTSASKQSSPNQANPSGLKKCWNVYGFWIKTAFKLIWSTGIDFYTDFLLAMEWKNEYVVHFQNGESCTENSHLWMGDLFLGSSILGCVMGFCSIILSFCRKYAKDESKKLKLESIEFKIDFAKLVFEDFMGNIMIGMIMLLNYGDATNVFYQSYCVSIVTICYGVRIRKLWSDPIRCGCNPLLGLF
eukprot:827705_1